MTIVLFWAAALALYAAITELGRRRGVIPVVSQLAAATFILPAAVYFGVTPATGLHGRDLVAPDWVRLLYSLNFSVLLGCILADVADVRVSRASLRIALPSFTVPLAVGIATATLLLPQADWSTRVAVGLLFSITAIPVLYLYLKGIGYPAQDTRRLVHAAILMDMACWSLFALTQGAAAPEKLLWPVLCGLSPLLLHYVIRVRRPALYGLVFLLLIFVMDRYRLNAMVFGILYVAAVGLMRQPFALPASRRVITAFQNHLAVPLTLTFGVVQIDFDHAFAHYTPWHLAGLLVLPVASKMAGNWIGLKWAHPDMPAGQRRRETVLLNIRGLTEIVFLNLLFQHGIIDATLYFSIMLMGLASTLLPAITGAARARRFAALSPDPS
ncbi:sodium:proton antiporter [Bordetella genomosp. 13]|uniref:sodium:proton antiporter n=1 Tax=Bordetella genomosp. 13 TaxID=463040 RepID=UPI00119F1FEA|nr:sodium:proton antiporter [Bordetella genomosp. 13]